MKIEEECKHREKPCTSLTCERFDTQKGEDRNISKNQLQPVRISKNWYEKVGLSKNK
jgi:hypothetical protein